MSDHIDFIEQSDENVIDNNIDDYEMYLIENDQDVDQSDGWIAADIDIETISTDDFPY